MFEAPGSLLDIAGQHHHGPLVEDNVKLERRALDRLQDSLLVRLPSCDRWSGRPRAEKRQVPAAARMKAGVRACSASSVSSFLAGLKRRAPFSATTRSKVKFRKNPLQVGRSLHGYQDQLACPSAFYLLQGFNRRRIDVAYPWRRCRRSPLRGATKNTVPHGRLRVRGFGLLSADFSKCLFGAMASRRARESGVKTRICRARAANVRPNSHRRWHSSPVRLGRVGITPMRCDRFTRPVGKCLARRRGAEREDENRERGRQLAELRLCLGPQRLGRIPALLKYVKR